MHWVVYFTGAVLCLFLAVVFAAAKGKAKRKGRFCDPSKILFVGMALASVLLFIPICINAYKYNDCGFLEMLFISVYTMIQLVLVNVDFGFITENIAGLSGGIFYAYSFLFSILFVAAPLLTFGFVLSFFKNVSARRRYLASYRKDVFIFSDLNEKSLALAESLMDKDATGRAVIFANMPRSEEAHSDLAKHAQQLGAICFQKEMAAVNFSFHSKNCPIRFFTIGEDPSENVNQAFALLAKYQHRAHTHLYVFSTQVEADLLLANAVRQEAEHPGSIVPIQMKVRRINEVQSLIFRTLYDGGHQIFEHAIPAEDGRKHISAVIVGLGRHGTEMLKALVWFCQMDGYQVEINAFDASETAESAFSSLCPELMDDTHNGNFHPDGEANYQIFIHSGMDARTKAFDDAVFALPTPTYVFVALGEDEKNIQAAIKLRTRFERAGVKPQIQTVIYHTDKKKALQGITNFKGQPYEIEFIGDIKTAYSEEVILASEAEQAALQRHLKWGQEADFWKYEYNYKSSMASAIHHKMKQKCGIPGADKPAAQRTEAEKWAIRRLEHRRWNAYMRSEGYCYAQQRNDLAKTHNCLIPFDQLPLSEQEKDDD